MNKLDLTKDVARRLDVSIKDATNVVDEVLGAIKVGTMEQGELKLLGFGSFKAVDKAARVGRNPATGIAIEIAAKTVVKFKPYF